VKQAIRVPWSRDDLVIACGRYFTLPFGQMHARNSKIIEIAQLLERTPSSVAMKLLNFASLDPEQKARGIRGLAGHSRADEQVWNDFNVNWEQMVLLSEASLQVLQTKSIRRRDTDDALSCQKEDAQTEAERIVKVRILQSFFRRVVLAAYDSRCCITGIPVTDMLVASHILPWGEFPAERLNPRNGLCLTADFDRAFDRGLISFDEDSRLIMSPVLRSYLPNEAIESEFVRREGQRLVYPERFSPDARFFAYHRSQIFMRTRKKRDGRR
jgi:putative restriction endonuclease